MTRKSQTEKDKGEMNLTDTVGRAMGLGSVVDAEERLEKRAEGGVVDKTTGNLEGGVELAGEGRMMRYG